MNPVWIRAFRSNADAQDALRAFAPAGWSGLYWRVRCGPLQRIAEAYVPFWVYGVSYQMNGMRVVRWFAMDAVSGSLDLFEFPALPREEELRRVESRNVLQAALSPQQAEELLREKALRVIFQQGFFKLRGARIEIVREPLELYMPYWLGFHGNRGEVRCRVMDAVRRCIEGPKASVFFEQWLAA